METVIRVVVNARLIEQMGHGTMFAEIQEKQSPKTNS
jgi:hypothetical protein